MKNQEYAGFWIRTGAAIIDTIILFLIISPLLTLIYGTDYWLNESLSAGIWDVVLSYFFPAIAVLLLWTYKSATPGKMATKLIIVDAKTGGKPTTGQFIWRYVGYYLSAIPLLIGIFWVAFDKKKQGWHDKLAGTVVLKINHIESETSEIEDQD